MKTLVMNDLSTGSVTAEISSNLKFQIWVVVAMVIWGLSWSNAKFVGQYVPSEVLMFWRFFFSTLALVPVLAYCRMKIAIPRPAIGSLLLCAAMLTAYNYSFFTGTHMGMSGIGGVIVTTINPLLTTLILVLLFRKPLNRRESAGLVAGVLGGLILLEVWNIHWQQLISGSTGMFLFCALTWSIITIASPYALADMHIFLYSFWVFLLAALFSVPLAWPVGLERILVPDLLFWINMALVSLGSLTFATSIYFMATKRLGPDKAASFIFVVPVSAMGFSMVIFSEVLRWHTVVGGSIAILAVYLLNSGRSTVRTSMINVVPADSAA